MNAHYSDGLNSNPKTPKTRFDVCVPPHQEGHDIYFTQLTYDSIAGEYDPYPDIMIGRCSVDDTEQVQNVVRKILDSIILILT